MHSAIDQTFDFIEFIKDYEAKAFADAEINTVENVVKLKMLIEKKDQKVLVTEYFLRHEKDLPNFVLYLNTLKQYFGKKIH